MPRAATWWVLGPVLIYLVLVLCGVSQSSIGIPGLRQDPAAPLGLQVGGSVGIRSDEYLTSTPLFLGVAATGDADDANPLTAPQGFTTQLPSGPVSSVVLLDGTLTRLGPWLPDQMLLAAHWWLPFLLLALGAPVLVASWTGSRALGLVAAALMVLSPVSAWWSFSPLGILGFTTAGAAALVCGVRHAQSGSRLAAVAWCAASALLLARTPLHYQPWAIVLALTLLAVTIVPMTTQPAGRRAALVAVGLTGGASLTLAAGVLLENRESIMAALGTVYPGARVASGGANPLQEVFAATGLSGLKDLTVAYSNASEISSGFAVAGVWAVLLLVRGVHFRDATHRRATLTLLGFTAFWAAWSLVDFGAWASHVPLLSLVPSNRSADVLGYLCVLLLVLVLPGVRDVGLRTAALVSGSVALVAAYAVSLLRAQHVADLPVAQVWVSSAVLGVVVLLVTRRPQWWVGYALAVAAAATLVWNVNPVLVGLADLRDSETARLLATRGAEAREAGELWAGDDLYLDAAMVANGVPSLSSRQLAGPDRAAWLLLDPSGQSEEVWNRGGSYITFAWTAEPELTFSNPAPDVIVVSGSPCTVADRLPGLSTVVSSGPIELPCLAPGGTITWGGQVRWLNEVS